MDEKRIRKQREKWKKPKCGKVHSRMQTMKEWIRTIKNNMQLKRIKEDGNTEYGEKQNMMR
jgi:hypothetical protein